MDCLSYQHDRKDCWGSAFTGATNQQSGHDRDAVAFAKSKDFLPSLVDVSGDMQIWEYGISQNCNVLCFLP